MSRISLIYYDTSGNAHAYTDVLSFRIVKDYYLPYGTMSAEVVCPSEPPTPKKLVFKINGTIVHSGIVDKVNFRTEPGRKILYVESKSFTSMLCQNQMTPGLIADVSIGSLIHDYYTIPEISCEDDTSQINYIYCKKGSTMWNAVENFTQKLYNRYPYVRGNKVMTSLPSSPDIISAVSTEISSSGVIYDYTRMFSHMHMEDINGTFNTYNLTNPKAEEKNIVRHRQLDLDRQYLNDPALSLVHKSNFSNRIYLAKYIEISKAVACDLCDKVHSGLLQQNYINRIEISGSNGVEKTKIYAYYDDYCNNL